MTGRASLVTTTMADTGPSAAIAVMVRIEGGGWRDAGDLKRRARAAVGAVCDGAAQVGEAGEVSILFTDDETMRQLNLRYRGHDRPTNVLAFPSDPPFMGDIVLAAQTVAGEAESQAKPIGDHVSHLIVHATLHLLGFDHQTKHDRDRMEAEEVRILGRLGIPDPYVLGGSGA